MKKFFSHNARISLASKVIRPMLAERINLNVLYQKVKKKGYLFQEKYDGERIVCYKNDSEIKFFTWRGHNVS